MRVQLAVLLCVAPLLAAGCVMPSFPSVSDGKIKAFAAKDLANAAPNVPEGVPHEYVLPENSSCNPFYNYDVQWAFGLSNKAYSSFGGFVDIWLVNGIKTDGARPMHVYAIGISVEGTFYKANVSKVVDINTTEYLGFLRFKTPEASSCKYIIKLAFFSQNASDGKWHDYGFKAGSEHELALISLPTNNTYRTSHNTANYYERLNGLVNYSQVSAKANEFSSQYSGARSIYAMLAAFDFVHQNVVYTADPPGRDVWSSPKDTLASMKGDCEDYTILYASLVGALGGACRAMLTDRHMFSVVYAGNLSNLKAIERAVSLYYDQELELAFFSDKLGYWIVADATQASYFGGLPNSGIPVAGEPFWGFNSNVTKMDIIDIMPKK